MEFAISKKIGCGRKKKIFLTSRRNEREKSSGFSGKCPAGGFPHYELAGRIIGPGPEKTGRVRPYNRDVPAEAVAMTTTKRYYVETEITLHLLPFVIAQQIRKIGAKICRISVQRTHWHHYNVTVRTRSIPKELEPVELATIVTKSATGKRSHKNKPGCST
jgi:hypothetical protein